MTLSVQRLTRERKREAMVAMRRLVWTSIALAACSVDSPDNQFGLPSTTVAASTNPGGTSDTGDEASGDSVTDSDGSGPSAADTTGSTDATTTGAPGTTSGVTTLGGSTDDGAGSTGGGSPGMYSECLVPEDCMAPNNVCVVVNMTDGFCTNMGCSNPAVDCDPAPGGTAPPICFPVDLNGMADSSCALDCSAGQLCPPGMTCFPLQSGSICA